MIMRFSAAARCYIQGFDGHYDNDIHSARCYLLLDATLGVLMDILIKNEIHCC